MFKFSFIYSYFLFNDHKYICLTYVVHMMFDVHKWKQAYVKYVILMSYLVILADALYYFGKVFL